MWESVVTVYSFKAFDCISTERRAVGGWVSKLVLKLLQTDNGKTKVLNKPCLVMI